MKLIAHRGYTTKYIKENTLEAFANAFNNGFIGIECDVRKTKDDKLVICHDAFIDRVSNGSGLLSSYTYKELLNFNFGSTKVPSKIPLLKDVLIKYSGIKLIELKCRINLEEIISLIDDNTYFISFDSTYMFELKKKYPEFKFGVLNYILNSNKEYSLDIICLLDSVVTEKIVNYFLKRNILVYIYGIGNKINYKRDDIYYIVDKKYS